MNLKFKITRCYQLFVLSALTACMELKTLTDTRVETFAEFKVLSNQKKRGINKLLIDMQNLKTKKHWFAYSL